MFEKREILGLGMIFVTLVCLFLNAPWWCLFISLSAILFSFSHIIGSLENDPINILGKKWALISMCILLLGMICEKYNRNENVTVLVSYGSTLLFISLFAILVDFIGDFIIKKLKKNPDKSRQNALPPSQLQ